MSARTTRTRLLAASTVALAALALSACDNGQGVRDEGPSAASKSSAQPTGSSSTGGSAPGSTSKPARSTGGTAGGMDGGTTAGGSGGASGSSGKTSGGSTGDGKAGGSTRNTACNGSNTKTTATEVTRPLNHMLLTVTNTGSKNCDLTGYPVARFGEAQAVPPVAEETHPQAVVTLTPGESGYAGVRLSAADGSGGNGYTAKTLVVGFDKGASARPALPAKGVYVDDKLLLTYWQQSLDDALTY
ncbi:hypothetical protein BKI49_20505 [Streptomyces sp. Tue6028]|uniref:DUF4232 domain-containing protein n=1 Tax=Streptomyces sp. Tue6028 TaxID=2036037 RepID=UPI000BB2D795|nr:DUF4232 domain-containing protein [Streptomyces sp. Tue6028]PBC61977.1 hypothetical protein BKI49_20505 [Streptomyces sp. Tue6028]